jgi:hypothetical protein
MPLLWRVTVMISKNVDEAEDGVVEGQRMGAVERWSLMNNSPHE